jgi:nicotinamidase-related amidase/glutathione S-transferase/alkylated DNA repair dioxygenase AlkB
MSTYDQLAESVPQFEARQALLILDLQNDFLSINSKLPVDSESGFVQNIKALVPVFRDSGDVIWIRSEFETERPVNDQAGEGETVITDKEVPEKSHVGGGGSRRFMHSARAMELLRAASARHDEQHLGSPEPEGENETFLSRSSDGKAPICCMPNTLGSEFADAVAPSIEYSRDSVLTKSYYSAFNSTPLLPSLRGNLVTELFVCGALSNISIYATALDAARHGYSITILKDCLGYRDEDRHREAMRQMTELMGAEVKSSKDLIEEIKSEQSENAAKAQKSSRVPVGSAMDKAEFEQLLEGLTLNAGPSATANTDIIPPAVKKGQITTDIDRTGPPRAKIAALAPMKPSEGPKGGHQGTTILGPSIEVDEDADFGSSELEPAGFLLRRGRERASAKVDAEKERAAKINGVERRIPRRPRGEDTTKRRVEKSDRQPTPTLEVLEAASAALAQVASDDKAPASQPGSAVPGLTPANVETATTHTVRSVPGGRLSQTKIRQPPALDPGDVIGEGDSRLVVDILLPELKDTAFERLKNEVQWKTMEHRGGEVPRLVAVEAQIGADGSYPIYRHPADESPPVLPFSPITLAIKREVEKLLKHPINHVLIQYYRNGQDYISEHSDKTLDIVRGSSIANVSIGAQRTMTIRTKRPAKDRAAILPAGNIASKDEEPDGTSGSNTVNNPPTPPPTRIPATRSEVQPAVSDAHIRHVQRIPMPHNSIFILGQTTNMRWLHGIRQDKRPTSIKSAEETAFNGERISLTFRHIGTFLDKAAEHIWGQGARSKSKETAGKVINGDTEEAEGMIRMFGRENHESEFDWDKSYGAGFDALNIVTKRPKLFFSSEDVAGLRVRLCLAEKGVRWESGADPPPAQAEAVQHPKTSQSASRPRLIDIDPENSELEGDLAILSYLNVYHGRPHDSNSPPGRATTARILTRTHRSDVLLNAYRNAVSPPIDSTAGDQQETDRDLAAALGHELDVWETYTGEPHLGQFIAGPDFSIADCAFWPVLRDVNRGWAGWDGVRWKGGERR